MNNSETVSAVYQSKLSGFRQKQLKISKSTILIGWTRLLFFILICAFIWAGLKFSGSFFIAAILSTAGFLFLIKIHLQKKFEKELCEKKIQIIENEISSLNYQPGFWYNGEKFHHPASYSYDLDVFGDYSIFHYINRAATESGQKKVAEQLIYVSTDKNIIRKRQEAVKEINKKSGFRLHWQSLGLMLPQTEKTDEKLKEKLEFQNNFYQNNFIKVLLILAPLSTVSATIYSFLTGNSQILLYAILLNLAITGYFLKKVNKRQKAVDGLQKLMSSYSRMIDAFLNEKWNTELLKKDLNELHEAKNAFSELANISEWFDRRMNVVTGILFNSYFLYDLYCVIRLEKWKTKYKDKISNWFESISEIECLQSLGTFAFNHPEFTIPDLAENISIEATAIAHPLIPRENNIPNDFLISHPQKIVLITGSNMSGKSTFLRTIGTNLILAQSGLPVNAIKMCFSPMKILTSLRQADSLHENVSLFHAELLRIKSIREELKKGQLTLVLLDEMLRGTNSEDKRVGSRQLIEELTEENIFGLIATHDLELGKLQDIYPATIRNECFESIITNNELIFDYKLKTGIAQNKNATFLLNKMGIIHTKKTITEK